MSVDHILENLSDVQKAAVTHPGGPLLIFAGAGSGKTRVLTHRIAWLIGEQNVNPNRIFAVTFTNKAAGEMKERVENIFPGFGHNVWISTFHSACVKILRRDAERIGYDPNFAIFDDADQLSLIKQVMKNLKIESDDIDPRRVRSLMDRAKCDAADPSIMSDHLKRGASEAYERICDQYAKEIKQNNAFDFGDLIVKAIELLEGHESLRDYYRERLQHILVDEFQDTNTSQYRLLKLLLGDHENISVVGDDDQSIYHWRGANIHNILDFEKDYPDSKVIILGENYRSSKIIIEAASAVIRGNKGRRDKELFTKNPMGDRITIFRGEDEYDEARFISREMENLIVKKGYSNSDIAVFYRTNAQSRVFEEELSRNGIPFKVVGGLRFYDRKEIKDVIAYLRVMVNPADSVSAMRIVNVPARGIGKTTVGKILELALDHELNFMQAVKKTVKEKLLPKGAVTKVSAFLRIIDELTRDMEVLGPQQLVRMVLERSTYLKMLEKDKSIEALTRKENVEELVQALGEFEREFPDEGISSFVEQCTLISDQDLIENSTELVHLLTVHAAKGLEFPVAFIVGLEDGLFPHSRSLDSPFEMEEERRLFYVAVTRAMKQLFLSSAEKRRSFGGRPTFTLPSRFCDDIPESLLLVEESAAVGRIDPYAKHPKGWDLEGRYGLNRGGKQYGRENVYDFNTGQKIDKKTEPEVPGEPTIDYSYSQDPQQPQGISIGIMVRHAKLGKGKVLFLEGEGEYATAIVQFDKAGVKKLRLMYAKLKPI